MKIKFISIIFFLFLTACGSKVIVVNREPITCTETMKTNGDMAKCLLEYKEKYK